MTTPPSSATQVRRRAGRLSATGAAQRFATHVVVGTGCFIVVGACAVILHLLVAFGSGLGIAAWMSKALLILEAAVFVLDFALFVVYTLYVAFLFLREVYEGVDGAKGSRAP